MRRVALWVVVALAASCGSRSALLFENQGATGGTSSGGTGIGGGSATGATGGTEADAATDVEVDAAPPPPPCKLVAAGPAADVVSFSDRHATAPSVVTLGPSEVAVQTFASGGDSFLHSDIRLVRFSMGPSWPGSFAQTSEALLYGIESHGWGNLVVSPAGQQLALTWHGDQGGKGRPQFRLWNVPAWSPEPPLDIASEGEAVISMASGASVGPMGVGHAGQGYAVVWRDVGWGQAGAPTRPVVAVLDAKGQGVLGPHPVAAFSPYPGRSPAVAWTGSAYLMATSFVSCSAGDALCVPLSVVISRVRPASGDAWDDSGVDLVTVLSAKPGSQLVGSASLSQHGGRTYVVWSESDDGADVSPRRVMVAELLPNGEPASGPVLVDPGAPLASRVTVLASDLGVTASWAEDSDIAVPDNVVGRSHIVSTHLDADLNVLSERVTVPATRWDSYGAPRAAALAMPRSIVLVWAGRREVGAGYDDTFAARLDCAK